MYNHILYLAFWVANSCVLFLFGVADLKENIVLGNWRFNSFESAIYAGFWLTFLYWVWWDFGMVRGIKLKNKFVILAYFLFVNFFSVWAVSLFHYIFGFRINNQYWILPIGILLTIVQLFVWKNVVKRNFFQ